MNTIEKGIMLIKEFTRYLIVGGSAFIVDFGVLYICNEYLIPKSISFRLYLATTLGFLMGLVFNYILSVIFVFKDASKKSKRVKNFLIFLLIGIIGLSLTNLGMHIGVNTFAINYIFVKMAVTGFVLVWNYTARKILIFM